MLWCWNSYLKKHSDVLVLKIYFIQYNVFFWSYILCIVIVLFDILCMYMEHNRKKKHNITEKNPYKIRIYVYIYTQ